MPHFSTLLIVFRYFCKPFFILVSWWTNKKVLLFYSAYFLCSHVPYWTDCIDTPVWLQVLLIPSDYVPWLFRPIACMWVTRYGQASSGFWILISHFWGIQQKRQEQSDHTENGGPNVQGTHSPEVKARGNAAIYVTVSLYNAAQLIQKGILMKSKIVALAISVE